MVLGAAPIRRLSRRVLVTAWARRTLRAGSALIIDTETTDLHGDICQLTVLDLTGRPILNSFVRPSVPIATDASRVHGIHDVDVVDAPVLADLSEQLLEVTRDRQLLAWNAPFDRDALARGLRAHELDPAHLADASSWHCLMRARARRDSAPWRKLGGPHDAFGDCLAALAELKQMASWSR
jgi:DNA polymerase III epsilon subunit-like protein